MVEERASAAAWLIDAHVHLHAGFDDRTFFASAVANFERGAAALGVRGLGCLMFTEAHGAEEFRRLAAGRTGAAPGVGRIEPTDEPVSAVLVQNGTPRLALIAGRQIQTAERLEVLALGTTAAFPDGRSLRETLDRVAGGGALAVVPWGFGKWWGRRGRLLEELLRDPARPVRFVGDNGGRPRGWPQPKLLRVARAQRIWDLPGSDPLPLAGQATRAGSYGLVLPVEPDPGTPFAQICSILTGLDAPPPSFGYRETIVHFVRAQTGLRMARTRR